MKINKKALTNVLTLLEASVDSQATTGMVEVLAKKHVDNVKKISDIQAQIDSLLQQQNGIEDANENIKDDILEMIGDTKSQMLRFGKLIVDFKVTRETGTTKSSPQWKNITASLQKTYEIEQKIVDKLVVKFNNGNKTFTTVNKELSITKESIQLQESFGNFLHNIWISLKSVILNLVRSFTSEIDHLEELLHAAHSVHLAIS